MHLVLIETSGNQNYIFTTNKLKENVGASELTYQAGTAWILDAVHQAGSSPLISLWRNNDQLREKLLDQNLNPRIHPDSSITAEVIVAASGKALLLTQNWDTAKQIIQAVSLRALHEAPGLDICGVISEPFDWNADGLGEINRQVHQKFERVRSHRPSPNLRFLRLPVVAECATSGLPATSVDSRTPDGKPVLRSAVSRYKRSVSAEGFDRIQNLLRNEDYDFAKSIQVLDTEGEQSQSLEWLAVVHADGNGLGEIFLDFHTHLQQLEPLDTHPNRNYVEYLRRFSLALDFCTEQAFLSALNAFKRQDNNLLPVVPLILGGDDLTIVCDGKSALRFTQMFLTAFEAETSCTDTAHYNGVIPAIAQAAFKVDRLSACAGVAIIKPHFPFSIAYELAEKLTKSAKQVKEIVKNTANGNKSYPCSALDFHMVYDASGVDLSHIRKKLLVDNGQTQLHSRPYVVTPDVKLPQDSVTNLNWVSVHRWETFEQRVKKLAETDEEGRRKLPNSQIHDLRAGLTLGQALADARYQLIYKRYAKQGISTLEGSEKSLFVQEPDIEEGTGGKGARGKRITGLLDAIDAIDFLAVETHEESQIEESETSHAE
ncbi:hypothetical protein C7B76_04915 [filamentous cyanobacterium CCP2]|nr:hypothetical protein C7B76_04915 [filamentous cyanobacterium CCP2]